MRILVTGATGVIGRRAVAALVGGGHEVTGVARGHAKSEVVRSLHARAVAIDLFDPAAVRAAVKGQDAVINLATCIPAVGESMTLRAWTTNDRLRREASANLVEAALAEDVQHYIQESITFPYVDAEAQWINETQPTSCSRVMESANAAEAHTMRFISSGRVGIVLRFSQLCARESSHGRAFQTYLRWRVAPLLGDPRAFASWIHADDAGTAVLAALKAPAGVYNVSEDEPLTRRQLADALAQAEDRAPPFFVPPWLVALGGETARALMRSQRISNERFKAATGWSPRFRSAVHGWRAPAHGRVSDA